MALHRQRPGDRTGQPDGPAPQGRRAGRQALSDFQLLRHVHPRRLPEGGGGRHGLDLGRAEGRPGDHARGELPLWQHGHKGGDAPERADDEPGPLRGLGEGRVQL